MERVGLAVPFCTACQSGGLSMGKPQKSGHRVKHSTCLQDVYHVCHIAVHSNYHSNLWGWTEETAVDGLAHPRAESQKTLGRDAAHLMM